MGSKPAYFGGLWSDSNFGLWELQCEWPNDPNFARSPGWRTVVWITSAVSWREKSAKTELKGSGIMKSPIFWGEDQTWFTWCKSMELLRDFPWKIAWMIFWVRESCHQCNDPCWRGSNLEKSSHVSGQSPWLESPLSRVVPRIHGLTGL